MAVITKFIVVRDGVELDQVFTDKKEAEAYDKMLDAAQDLTALIKQGDLKIGIDDKIIEEISIHLAKNAPAVGKILKSVKPLKPVSKDPADIPPIADEPVKDIAKARRPKTKAKNRVN